MAIGIFEFKSAVTPVENSALDTERSGIIGMAAATDL
jgi:hypothetical protein